MYRVYFIKGIGEYVFYKFQFAKLIHGQIDINDVVNHKEISNFYKYNIKKIVFKTNGKVGTSYLDSKLEKKYGVFKKDKNIVKLLEGVHDDIIQIINMNKKDE